MRENGQRLLIRDMDEAIKYGQMEVFMRVTGKLIRQMVEVD